MNEIENIEFKALDISKDCPVLNMFSDGVYARTVTMPKGSIIIGKKHLTRHLNIVLTGSAKVWMDGEYMFVNAPDIIESKEGCTKVLYILEDMMWTTIHPTNETNVDIIEDTIIEETSDIKIEEILKGLQWLG